MSLGAAYILLIQQTHGVQELLDMVTSIQTSKYIAIPTQVGVSSGAISREGMGVGS